MSEKTEQPTDRRLRDARKKGDVLKSQEVTTTVSFLVMIVAMVSMVPWLWKRLQRLFELVWSDRVMNSRIETLQDVLVAIGFEVFWLAVPIMLIVAASTVAATFAQVGGLFSSEPIKPNFDVLNPVTGLQRMFSTRNLFDLIKMLLKVCLMGSTIAWVIIDAADTTMRLMYAPPIEGAHAAAGLLLKLFVAIAALYVAHAAIDYGHQYWEYMKKMRMSKDEVKREYKESEGDPDIKYERKRLAQELLFGPPGEATKKASVLVVNPTHFAVALFYEPGVTDLPMVVEKALDDQALFLRGVARDAGVPVFEYPTLARQLHANVQTFKYIPKDLFPAVAEVLQWVNKVKPASP